MRVRPVYAAIARGLSVTYFVPALGFVWVSPPPAIDTLPEWIVACGVLFATILVLCEVAAKVLTLKQASWGAIPREVRSFGGVVILLPDLLVLHGVVPPLLYELF